MLRSSILMTLVVIAQFAFAQTEPSAQPTNLNFSNIKSYKASASFTAAGSSRNLVLVSTNPITFQPVDNVAYLKGEYLNGAKVVYNGTSSFTFFKNLMQGKTYYVAVFAYNQLGNNINYKSDNPLTGQVTTTNAGNNTYYSSIDFSDANVITSLTNLIQLHTLKEYSEFDENVVRNIIEKDTVVSGELKSYIECQYSGEIKVYDHEDFTYQDFPPFYSREHRIAKSWYDFTGLAGSITGVPEGTDYHSLALVQGDVNTRRSNHPFGDVVSPGTGSHLDFVIGDDANNNYVAEPRADRKGDVARAHFYVMLAYNNKYGENWGLDNLISDAVDQDIQVLLDWHYNDLPDDFEKTRHEYVAEIQGNRNPLIDFPQLVDCIDFTNMTKKASCDVSVGIANDLKNEFGTFIYPNPSTGVIYMNNVKAKDVEEVHIFNMVGVEQTNFSINGDSINIENLSKGLYIISIQSKKKNYISKFQLK